MIFTLVTNATPVFCEITPIDAQHAAQSHNNKGVDYLSEGDYFAAIKEFKIAIGINPSSQTTAVYQNNLGRAYLKLAQLSAPQAPFALWAQVSFEAAIAQDCMNLTFYKNLVETFSLRGNLRERLAYYKKDSLKNHFSSIIVALILEKQGQTQAARSVLSNFAETFPNLIIVRDVKKHIESLEEP